MAQLSENFVTHCPVLGLIARDALGSLSPSLLPAAPPPLPARRRDGGSPRGDALRPRLPPVQPPRRHLPHHRRAMPVRPPYREPLNPIPFRVSCSSFACSYRHKVTASNLAGFTGFATARSRSLRGAHEMSCCSCTCWFYALEFRLTVVVTACYFASSICLCPRFLLVLSTISRTLEFLPLAINNCSKAGKFM